MKIKKASKKPQVKIVQPEAVKSISILNLTVANVGWNYWISKK
jgi:hypothetical protein